VTTMASAVTGSVLTQSLTAEEREADYWIRWFMIIEVVSQLAIISPLGGARTLIRMAAFGSSLAFFVLVRGKAGYHPARAVALVVLALLGLSVLNPSAAALPAALAQMALYAAIMAPLFWVPRLWVTTKTLRTLLMIMWAFHTIGSLVGVLQVYFPGHFQPNVSPVILGLGRGYAESLKIVTTGGVRVFRPMGLTDVPGGAASSGLYAVVLGIGVYLTSQRRWLSMSALASVLLGLMCLYLSQIRALMVVTGISIVGVAAVLGIRRDYKRLAGFGLVLAAVLIVSFRGAVSMASDSVEHRVRSLTAATPQQIYEQNRGGFLKQAFEELLPEYPLGAGIGRWGMMQSYFGDKSNPDEALWAEIQWSGWILDGGAPLTIAYVWIITATLLTTLGVARWRSRGDPGLSLWAAVILGYSIGTCAFTFSYPVFLSQTGMEFWLLNATLFAAARNQARRDAWQAAEVA
jgi:hypothetical protein